MVAKASRSRVFAAEGVLPKDALSTPYTLQAYNQNQTKGELGGRSRTAAAGGRGGRLVASTCFLICRPGPAEFSP